MYYGLDIGGSKIEIGLFDEQLRSQHHWRVATPTDDYQTFIATIVALVEQADEYSGTRSPVGIGVPGMMDDDERLLSSNIPCANGKNIRVDLQAKLQRPIRIDNDCRCFVAYQASHGAGQAYKQVFCAIVGTGVAGGLAINGQLYQSRQGIAGEFGHLGMVATLQQKYQLPLRPCGCGLNNCYERFVSGPGLAFLYRHFSDQQQKPLSPPQIIELWRNHDPLAQTTMACYLDLLGSCFAHVMVAYDPDVIVLGGGLSQVDEMIQALPKAIENHLFGRFKAPPVVAADPSDAAGARGAALLIHQLNG